MSDGLMIILVIVVWLFVLAPLLLRGQRPINKTGEAFDDTRVVYEGGSGDIPARRHPRVLPKDVRSRAEEDDEDYELVEALTEEDDLLIDERRTPPVTEPVEELVVDDPRGEVVDGEVVEQPVAELPQGGSTAYSALESAEEVTAPLEDGDFYGHDDTYVTAADYLHPATRTLAEPVQELELDEAEQDFDGEAAAGEDDEELLVEDGDLTDEDLAFAKRRAGRGGWDPESDRRNSVDRYQRRRRTLAGLLAAVAVTLVLSIVVGGWAWAMVLLTGALTAVYLVALRKQVHEEKALRARRIRQLRRARLGVRRADDAEGGVPRELRRPGAVVVELDDESPDFDYLSVTEASFDPTTLRPVRGTELHRRRVG